MAIRDQHFNEAFRLSCTESVVRLMPVGKRQAADGAPGERALRSNPQPASNQRISKTTSLQKQVIETDEDDDDENGVTT